MYANPPVDPAAVERLRSLGGGEDDLLHEIVGLFLDQVPADLAGLRSAAAAGDATEAARLAHRLGGAARHVGATRLVGACARLEAAAGGGGELTAGAAAVQAEAEVAAHALRSLLAGATAPRPDGGGQAGG